MLPTKVPSLADLMLRLRPCSATILLQTELSPYSSGNTREVLPFPACPRRKIMTNIPEPRHLCLASLAGDRAAGVAGVRPHHDTELPCFQSDTGKPPQNANSVSKAGIDNGCLSSDNSNSSRAGKPTHHEFIPWFFPAPCQHMQAAPRTARGTQYDEQTPVPEREKRLATAGTEAKRTDNQEENRREREVLYRETRLPCRTFRRLLRR